MGEIRLGGTGMVSGRNAFGALPIQRAVMAEAKRILRKAYDNGFRFFDTARVYSDSEEKLGAALADVRDKVYLATKTMTEDVQGFWQQLETSLRLLRTDYVDLYQFHNPGTVPKPGDGSGLYEAMLEAKAQGKIRHIGITNHSLKLAHEAVESGLYETLQFPFSHLSGERDLELARACRDRGMGFIAMKALAGGLLTNAAAAYGFFQGFDHVLPIWGIQTEEELDQFIALDRSPPDPAEIAAQIEADRAQLVGNFCRGCMYCMPHCPQKINIQLAMRAVHFLRRQPEDSPFLANLPQTMDEADGCIECGECVSHCPYGLQIPQRLKESRREYDEYLAAAATR